MKELYRTNQNFSNNIVTKNVNYSLKERKIPKKNNNNILIYSSRSKKKQEQKYNIVNDIPSSFKLKEEQPIQEEDIDYLKLFSQKAKNTYDNPNNRQRKSKFFYSNRINTAKNMNQIQNQIHSKQRAVSTNLTQIPQKNIVEYPKNINKNSSKRATSREEHKIPQSRYNSFTNRGLEFVQKVENPIGKNIAITNQRFSGIKNNNGYINIKKNMKKIPTPINNGYIIHPNMKKINKIKNVNNNGDNKMNIRNKNYYNENNIYKHLNTTNGFYENANTGLNINHRNSKNKVFAEVNILNNIIIDKENINPNNNNSFNFNTIYNNTTQINKTNKIPVNLKLNRNNTNFLPNKNNLTDYNIFTISKFKEEYNGGLNQNKNTKQFHPIHKQDNNDFYTINNKNYNISNIIERQNYLNEKHIFIKNKKPDNPINLRESFIKIKPQDNNKNISYKNDMNIINNNNLEKKNITYNYQEKENNNNNIKSSIKKTQQQNNIDKYRAYNNNIDTIEVNNNILPNSVKTNQNTEVTEMQAEIPNYEEEQLIKELFTDDLKSKIYIEKVPNEIEITNPKNLTQNNLAKIPKKSKISQENIPNPQKNNNNSVIVENNINNQNSKNNDNISIHFPNPEIPVRKESNSKSISSKNSSNVIYNIFNASGWLKNYAVLTNPGCDKNGNQKTNQDSFVFKTDINGINNFNIFGVMDGHGPQGHFVSQFASKFIPFQIINHHDIKTLKDPEEIYQKIKYNEFEIINNIFLETDVQLKKVNFDANDSGCTCVLVIHIGSHIICANTGDSRAILISDAIGENNINDFYEMALSYDYKPEMPEEKQRIEAFGGVVEQLKNKMGEGVGPYRVWAKEGGYPGLAMSRSIGDLVGKKLGVIPNPGILEYELNKDVKYIVVASDGIWEFLSNENVKDIGKKYYKDKNPNGFCHELVKTSYKIWKENGVTVDDITAVVAFF
jgi:serine/threonine protein phosphatase PrpC